MNWLLEAFEREGQPIKRLWAGLTQSGELLLSWCPIFSVIPLTTEYLTSSTGSGSQPPVISMVKRSPPPTGASRTMWRAERIWGFCLCCWPQWQCSVGSSTRYHELRITCHALQSLVVDQSPGSSPFSLSCPWALSSVRHSIVWSSCCRASVNFIPPSVGCFPTPSL